VDNSNDKASPGQPFRAPRAETWNGIVDAGNAYRAGRLNVGAPPPTRPRQTDLVRIKNNSGADRARGEILLIDGKAITDLSDEHIWLLGDEPTDDGYFAILKQPIQSGDVGTAQVSGCCLAMVDVSDADHTRAKPAAGEYLLESSTDGPIEIIYSPGLTGEQECVVRFGSSGGGDSHFNFRTTAVMTSLAATASIYNLGGFESAISSGTVISSLIFGDLPVNTIGICILRGGEYHIIQPACPPEEEYL
jgi:hypothetical protein